MREKMNRYAHTQSAVVFTQVTTAGKAGSSSGDQFITMSAQPQQYAQLNRYECAQSAVVFRKQLGRWHTVVVISS